MVRGKAQAKEIRSTMSALHEPDMVVGGYHQPIPTTMGNGLVNSTIGGNWPSRVDALDRAVSDALAKGAGDARMNVRLEMLRGPTP